MPNDYEKLMQYAFYILAKKRYTVKEMRQKLTKYLEKLLKDDSIQGNKEIQGAKLVNEGVLRLEELGYLNDKSYTHDYVAQRIKLRPRGKFLLRRELIAKGVDKAVIEKCLADSEVDEFGLAKELLLKKAKKWERYEENVRKSKAYAFLASRGFERDAIYRAMESCYYNNANWD